MGGSGQRGSGCVAPVSASLLLREHMKPDYKIGVTVFQIKRKKDKKNLKAQLIFFQRSTMFALKTSFYHKNIQSELQNPNPNNFNSLLEQYYFEHII